MAEYQENEGRLALRTDSLVEYRGKKMRITRVLDLESVLARDLESDEVSTIPIGELKPVGDSGLASGGEDLLNLSDEQWEEAERRYEFIRPLLKGRSGRKKVEAVASKAGVNSATIYRWIDRYKTYGKVSALVPQDRGPKMGSVRLSPDVEEIVRQAIDEHYLNRQRNKSRRERKSGRPRKRTIRGVADVVERRCKNAGLKPPHPSTVRRWIMRLSERDKMRGVAGPALADEAFSAHKGKFPDAHWPLEVVQIDHTPLDIILVEEVHRLPIGRPWITLAIDVFSRVVVGFYVSLDPPGNLATGLCIARSILSKEKWLSQLGVENGSWPVWGKMRTIHADNAGEFRGAMLKKACADHDIDLTWRAVKKPCYGAHIERLLGTLNGKIHELEGSTYADVQEKGEYDAEADAVFTLEELEQWLTELIINDYHQSPHKGMGGVPPIVRYEEGIFGDGQNPGIGLPDRILDESRLRLDLMPFTYRTVQRHGIVWDHIEYYSDVLRRWIGSVEQDNPKEKRKFIVRRDSRDISRIYFFDPELKQYFEIPYRDLSHPAVSIWELREVQRWMKDNGMSKVDESSIFAARERMSAIQQKAVEETKKVRRMKQRKKQWRKADKPEVAPPQPSSVDPGESPTSTARRKVRPFDELEELGDE